jgi:hypothetical protein
MQKPFVPFRVERSYGLKSSPSSAILAERTFRMTQLAILFPELVGVDDAGIMTIG